MQAVLELIGTEPSAVVAETLDFLLYECSLDEAPSPEEVRRWQEILLARGGKFVRLAQICETWLEEEAE